MAAVVGMTADLGLVAAVDVTQAVVAIRAAATTTAARVAGGAVAAIKAAEIPKATSALAVVTPAVVIPAVMTPVMETSQRLMMLAVMVEGDATGALTTGHAPARSNVTVTPPSL
jgi:hypothetical protein